MMPKYGLTSDEIRAVNVSDAVDREWLKELCWQIAKLRESLDGARLEPHLSVIDNGAKYKVHLNK